MKLTNNLIKLCLISLISSNYALADQQELDQDQEQEQISHQIEKCVTQTSSCITRFHTVTEVEYCTVVYYTKAVPHSDGVNTVSTVLSTIIGTPSSIDSIIGTPIETDVETSIGNSVATGIDTSVGTSVNHPVNTPSGTPIGADISVSVGTSAGTSVVGPVTQSSVAPQSKASQLQSSIDTNTPLTTSTSSSSSSSSAITTSTPVTSSTTPSTSSTTSTTSIATSSSSSSSSSSTTSKSSSSSSTSTTSTSTSTTTTSSSSSSKPTTSTTSTSTTSSSSTKPTTSTTSTTSSTSTTSTKSTTSTTSTTPITTTTTTASKVTTTSTTTTSVPVSTLSSFQQSILDRHNFYRAKHGVPSLVWNDVVAQYAQDYADEYKCDGTLNHSHGPYGENLALGAVTATSAVDLFYDEIKYYNFTNPNPDHQNGHFTQVVWKSTTELGCAYHYCGVNNLYIICSYNPYGNIVSPGYPYYLANVLPPISS